MTVSHPSDLQFLKQKARVLTLPFDPAEVQSIVQQMKQALKAKGGGAGLAAPQIGINQCIVLCSFTRKIEDLQAMINPVYASTDSLQEERWEGCFSVPLTFAKISRWKTIEASYYTPEGDNIKKVLQGVPAMIYQHEVDHLLGRLILDRAKKLMKFDNEQEYQDFLNKLREEQHQSYKRKNPF